MRAVNAGVSSGDDVDADIDDGNDGVCCCCGGGR
jgi:hypothetical protein